MPALKLLELLSDVLETNAVVLGHVTDPDLFIVLYRVTGVTIEDNRFTAELFDLGEQRGERRGGRFQKLRHLKRATVIELVETLKNSLDQVNLYLNDFQNLDIPSFRLHTGHGRNHLTHIELKSGKFILTIETLIGPRTDITVQEFESPNDAYAAMVSLLPPNTITHGWRNYNGNSVAYYLDW